jgi:3',5'-cyclic AMP phosphodiesterase CpdA
MNAADQTLAVVLSSRKEPIVVPGNHDQKLAGNSFFGLGRKRKELTKLEWSSLVVDDDLQFVFYCFDSSQEAANFAKGRITKAQMMEVATIAETKAAGKIELRRYLSIALIHHHPYSFNVNAETPIQKSLKAVGLGDEAFLSMDESEDFLRWCAGRRVSLVMHGHKHVPRHVKQVIHWTHGKQSEWREITAVGCGSSLGAEGSPLSYNILEWWPASKHWSVTFFSDPGSGTGFEEIYVALHSAPAEGA